MKFIIRQSDTYAKNLKLNTNNSMYTTWPRDLLVTFRELFSFGSAIFMQSQGQGESHTHRIRFQVHTQEAEEERERLTRFVELVRRRTNPGWKWNICRKYPTTQFTPRTPRVNPSQLAESTDKIILREDNLCNYQSPALYCMTVGPREGRGGEEKLKSIDTAHISQRSGKRHRLTVN